MSSKKVQKVQKKEITKKTRGRPKKVHTSEELAAMKKPKLTLAEKQAIKLKAQRAKDAEKKARGETEPKNKARFYCTNKELQAEMIKWRDSSKIVEERTISEELGKMFLAICNKILNHSNFRNYDTELKADMRGYALYKLIRGLKNYNFQFNNPFAWCSQACFNSYLTVIGKHYKQLNIKKDLMQKLSIELQTYTGMNAASSLNKCIKSYLGNEVELD